MFEEKDAHFAVVLCDKVDSFCHDAFGMRETPQLVLFHSGLWSTGCTWVFNQGRDKWDGSSELNHNYLRDFVTHNYQLKWKEKTPWRLLFDPTNPFSKALWMISRHVPNINFAQFGELWDLRKNAVAVIFIAGALLGIVTQKVLKKLI